VSFTIHEASDLESLQGIVACLRRKQIAD